MWSTPGRGTRWRWPGDLVIEFLVLATLAYDAEVMLQRILAELWKAHAQERRVNKRSASLKGKKMNAGRLTFVLQRNLLQQPDSLRISAKS